MGSKRSGLWSARRRGDEPLANGAEARQRPQDADHPVRGWWRSCALRRVSTRDEPQRRGAGPFPDERKTVGGKRNVMILNVAPVGNYAVRLTFDDMHSSGIFGWDYLDALGREQEERWEAYLAELAAKGMSGSGRDASFFSRGKEVGGCRPDEGYGGQRSVWLASTLGFASRSLIRSWLTQGPPSPAGEGKRLLTSRCRASASRYAGRHRPRASGR